ncbi:MAG: DUF1559 domain-containing protein [Gemmataceae bacterium]
MALAMYIYESTSKTLPPAAVRGPDGKPLLSWRVLLLPYIEQDGLFREFKLDEPWDSPHNINLLDRMPPLYLPFRDAPVAPGHTYYQVIVGPGTPFAGPAGKGLDDLPNRASTFLIVEAKAAVPWTKPEDLSYDPDGPLPQLGGIFRDGRFRAAMADGRVRDLDLTKAEEIRAAIVGRGLPGDLD